MHIREAIRSDIPQLVQLCELQLGRNYLTAEELQSIFDHPASRTTVMSDYGFILGFLIAYHGPFQNISSMLGGFQENNKAGNQPSALLKTIVVSPDHQGKGIGKLLVEEWMNIAGPHCDLYSLNWQSGEVVPLNILLEKHGFRTLQVLREFWKKDSLKKKSLCPVCGEPPCRCDAMVYVRAGVS